jgi:hypothetical protein
MTLSHCNTDHSRKTPMNSPHSLIHKTPLRAVQTTALLLSLALAPQGCASSTPRAETPADLAQRAVRTSPVMQHARVLSGPHAFLPAPVTSFGAAAWGEHLYVLGGYRGESHHYTAEGQSASLGRLHVATGAWEELAGLERGLQSAALVAHEGTLIRVGGLYAQHSPDDAADAADRLRSTDEVARYDIASGRWTTCLRCPRRARATWPRCWTACCTWRAAGTSTTTRPRRAGPPPWKRWTCATWTRAGAPSRLRSSCAAWAWPRPAGSWWWWAAWTPSACRSA